MMDEMDGMDEKSKMTDQLLERIIQMAEDALGKRMKPAEPAMAAQVVAPDKDSLEEGLEKASDVVDKAPDMPGMEASDKDDDSEESDESRLLGLLEQEEDQEDEEKKRR